MVGVGRDLRSHPVPIPTTPGCPQPHPIWSWTLPSGFGHFYGQTLPVSDHIDPSVTHYCVTILTSDSCTGPGGPTATALHGHRHPEQLCSVCNEAGEQMQHMDAAHIRPHLHCGTLPSAAHDQGLGFLLFQQCGCCPQHPYSKPSNT